MDKELTVEREGEGIKARGAWEFLGRGSDCQPGGR
jgi:hypothetical protein